MLILTLPLHEKGLHIESFFSLPNLYTYTNKAALGQLCLYKCIDLATKKRTQYGVLFHVRGVLVLTSNDLCI